MAYLDDDQEIEALPSPPITKETTATTTTAAATVNLLVPDSTLIKSLFAIAVFLSLSLNPNPVPSNTLSPDPACAPTDDIPVSLVISQFYALTSFIFSAFTAFAALRSVSGSAHLDVNNIKGSTSTLRFHGHRIMLFVSDMGFILGVAFLLSAIVDLAQMKLGILSCGSSTSVTLVAVLPLLIFAPLSLLFSISSSMSAFMAAAA